MPAINTPVCLLFLVVSLMVLKLFGLLNLMFTSPGYPTECCTWPNLGAQFENIWEFSSRFSKFISHTNHLSCQGRQFVHALPILEAHGALLANSSTVLYVPPS